MRLPALDQTCDAISVFVIGNDPFGRRDLADRLERSADLEVVEVIDSVDAAVESLPESRANVVVVDDHLLEQGEASLCLRLRAIGCQIPCIVHAALPPDPEVIAGWAADAVVLKSIVGDELEAEIRYLVARRAEAQTRPVRQSALRKWDRPAHDGALPSIGIN